MPFDYTKTCEPEYCLGCGRKLTATELAEGYCDNQCQKKIYVLMVAVKWLLLDARTLIFVLMMKMATRWSYGLLYTPLGALSVNIIL